MSTLPPPPPRVLRTSTDRPPWEQIPESFFARVFQMPFLPRLWSDAARWKTTSVILPLLVLVLLLSATLAIHRSFGLRTEMRKWSSAYDARHPAVIVENGEVRVEGGGVIHEVFDDNTLLVDPEETVRIDEIETPEYIVVRKREIIRRRLFRTERTPIAEIAVLLGEGPTRFDGESLRAFEARFGAAVQLGVVALVMAFMLGQQFGVSLLYALGAGGLALAIRGRALELDFPSCFRVAAAASSLLVVVHVAMAWLGISPATCLGLLIWPAALLALTLWAVGRS